MVRCFESTADMTDANAGVSRLESSDTIESPGMITFISNSWSRPDSENIRFPGENLLGCRAQRVIVRGFGDQSCTQGCTVRSSPADGSC